MPNGALFSLSSQPFSTTQLTGKDRNKGASPASVTWPDWPQKYRGNKRTYISREWGLGSWTVAFSAHRGKNNTERCQYSQFKRKKTVSPHIECVPGSFSLMVCRLVFFFGIAMCLRKKRVFQIWLLKVVHVRAVIAADVHICVDMCYMASTSCFSLLYMGRRVPCSWLWVSLVLWNTFPAQSPWPVFSPQELPSFSPCGLCSALLWKGQDNKSQEKTCFFSFPVSVLWPPKAATPAFPTAKNVDILKKNWRGILILLVRLWAPGAWACVWYMCALHLSRKSTIYFPSSHHVATEARKGPGQEELQTDDWKALLTCVKGWALALGM